MSVAPLFISSMLYQLVRDPLDVVNKASVRVLGRQVNPHATFAPLGGVRVSDFDVPISRSVGRLERERVLHVLTNSLPYSRGGYAHRSHEIIRALNEGTFPAAAITRLAYPMVIGKRPLSGEDFIEGVEYIRSLPLLHPLTFERSMQIQADRIAEEARRRRAGVLHTTTPWPNAVATSFAAQRLGIPWVYEARGEPESTWAAAQPDPEHATSSEFYLASRSKETESMLAASAVIALSDVSKTDLELRGVKNVTVVPNAVRESELRQALPSHVARRKLGLGMGPFIGAVSSIVDYEGFDDLIRSLKFLPDEVKVLLVGDGSAVSRLKDLAEHHGLKDRVVFAGWQAPETIAEWYSALDVFVVPRKDTRVTRVVTPMKIQRAQSFGIPVVCSDLPALREVTGGNAVYVPAESPQHLAAATEKLLAGGRSRKSPVEAFTWEMSAERLAEIYRGLH